MKPTSTPTMSVAQACRILELGHTISASEEVLRAFRGRVRAASNGNGGYVRDMDDLTQAKEIVLTAYMRACEEAQKEQARKRAKEAERQEQEALKKKKARKKPPPKKVVPLLLTGKVNPYDAIRAFEWKREEARKATHNLGKLREQQMKKTVQTKEQESSLVGDTLSLLQTRQAELEQIRQREREIAEEQRLLQTRRIALEQAVEKALALSEQLRSILESVAQ